MDKNSYKLMSRIGMALVALILGACSNDALTDLNKNPDAVDFVIPSYLFTQIELNMPQTRGPLHQGMQYVATYKDVPDIGGKQFDYVGGFGFGIYSSQFNAIKQCMDALTTPADVNKIALCRIIRAYCYHMLTDATGDVPYKEASQALSDVLKPKYDTQQSIYMDMLKELDEAATSLNSAQPTFASADVFYSGDIVKWKKFAYTLMPRLAMRLSKKDETTAKKYALIAINGGVMTESADVAYLKYSATSTNPRAPYGEYQATQDPDNAQGQKLSSTLINQFKTTRDPRAYVLSVVWTKVGSTYVPDTTLASQRGMIPGSILGYPADFATYSEYSPIWWNRDTSPLVILSAAEAQLLVAEAVLLGWYTGTTEKAAYDLGVTRAMQQWALWPNVPSLSPNNSTISQQRITDYLTTGYPYKTSGTAAERLEQISTQKWLSLLGDDMEVWSNWRRTGYPKFNFKNWQGNQAYPGSVTGGEMFRRLPYPDERATNNANQQEALSRQGFPLDPSVKAQSDALLGRVWWDKP
jgi:hypothetical protein